MAELIYNQTKIPKEQYRYGLRSSAATGCGWVAIYNALTLLGRRVNIPALIRMLERQFPVVHGNAGTFVTAPAAILRRLGYETELCADRRQFDRIARAHPVCILFYYWRRKWHVGSHFVALHWTDGHFAGYNTYTDSVGADDYGQSLEAFLKAHGYFGCVLIAIREKNDP